MAEIQAFNFENRASWSKWLSDNHRTETEAWLIHPKKHAAQVGLAHADAAEEALRFGWVDGRMKNLDQGRFLLRYYPRKPETPWSQINKDRAERLLATGKMMEAGLDAILAAKNSGSWYNPYTDKEPAEAPPDLKRALQVNMRSWQNFNRFSASYRNMYIAWVNSAQKEESRQRRINEVVAHSLASKKTGEYSSLLPPSL